MPDKPLVTVVIPVYNYAGKVERAIRSVMAQTLNNLECFVVDDGSTDDTKAVVQGVIANDARFRYIHQDNAGVAIARNKGVFSGSAPYICCLDADDAIAPEFLEACVNVLEADPSLGVAYTGLWYIKPDGSEGLSPWPEEFDYDASLQGQTQIPTCNVARREVWERLGGQRQRYAPRRAGEEDAEMWLRAGAYGFNARKVTDAGLFIYSWLSGRVSGDRTHRMTDYRAWHPWAYDGQHPFASMSKTKGYSHAVRQYDEPQVSVIIPVGPNHVNEVYNALDSMDAQTFRRWEVIVVDDTGDNPSMKLAQLIERTYPYVRLTTAKKRGAGAARNAGASIARAPLLLFVDADDWLYPQALEKMLTGWYQSQSIVYTDYVGKAFIDDKLATSLGNRLLYRDTSGLAVISYQSADYQCERAMRQPETPEPYIWNLITSLVPKAWHDEIGGFDESMKSWEDWDYWLRMARVGKCFHRIAEPLVVYRFYSGGRRQAGLEEAGNLIQYLRNKYQGSETMPCNCKGNNRPTTKTQQSAVVEEMQEEKVLDRDFSLVLYDPPHRGDRRLVGDAVFSQKLEGVPMIKDPNGWRVDYGYRSPGQRFLVHNQDIRLRPQYYKPVQPAPQVVVPSVSIQPPPPPPNATIDPMIAEVEGRREFQADDLAALPGVTKPILTEFEIHGVRSFADILELGEEGLVEIKGVGAAKAAIIIRYLRQLQEVA